MKSEIEIEVERPGQLRQVLEPSLSSDKKVKYKIDTGERYLRVEVKTDGIGPLRGCTDTVFRLTTLARKLY